MNENKDKKNKSDIFESSSNDSIVELGGESLCYEDDPCAPRRPCDCLYGDLRVAEDERDTILEVDKFTKNNELNHELVDVDDNYNNVFVVVGNCKQNGKLKYWVRYHVVLSNDFSIDSFDHNCIYNVRTMLYVDGSSEPVSNHLETVNLVQKMTIETVDLQPRDTHILTNVVPLEQDTCPTSLKLKVCAESASQSVEDGQTQFSYIEEDITWKCSCCQEYDFTQYNSETDYIEPTLSNPAPRGTNKFISYCADDAGPCILCDKDKFLKNEKFQLSKHEFENDELRYSVDVTDTCLIYMRADIPGDGEGEVKGTYIAKGHGEPEYNFTRSFPIETSDVSVSKLNTIYGASDSAVLDYHNKNK